MRKKSQISLEFGLTLSFLIVMLLIVESVLMDFNYKSRISTASYVLKDYLNTLSEELILARNAYPKYTRNFEVLNRIGDSDLDFSIYNYSEHTEIVLKSSNENVLGELVYYLPFVVYGDLCEGKCNQINKSKDGIICVNACNKADLNCELLPNSCD